MVPIHFVLRLFEEITKSGSPPLVITKVHGTILPGPSLAVSTPTVVPVGELAGTFELLKLIVIMSLLFAKNQRRSAPVPSLSATAAIDTSFYGSRNAVIAIYTNNVKQQIVLIRINYAFLVAELGCGLAILFGLFTRPVGRGHVAG